MIVPMKKYVFLVYHSNYIDFLDELRGLGVALTCVAALVALGVTVCRAILSVPG